MPKTKIININIDADDVRSFMAEFMTFAFVLESGMSEDVKLTHLSGCPVSREMLGTAIMMLIENLNHMRGIDGDTLSEISRNIDLLVPSIPMGLRRPSVLM
jgi:hypothetical protein